MNSIGYMVNRLKNNQKFAVKISRVNAISLSGRLDKSIEK